MVCSEWCVVYRPSQVLRLAGVPSSPHQCKADGRPNHTQPHPLAVQPFNFQNNDTFKLKMKRRACFNLLRIRRII